MKFGLLALTFIYRTEFYFREDLTCDQVSQIYGLFCKTRPPVSFVMSKFQKQNLVKVPFHFVSQQKTKSSAVVFDVAFAVRHF